MQLNITRSKSPRGELKLRDKRFAWGERTLIMGVVNTTPDSFSGDGISDVTAAAAHAMNLIEQGADIIDIGGESTRPGYTPVSAEVECARVLPVVSALRAKSSAIISVDTRKPHAFRQAAENGADILNSISVFDDALVAAACESGAPLVVVHNQDKPVYDGDVVDCVMRYLDGCASRAIRLGIKPEHIILDPGIGFAKTAEHNLQLLKSLDRLSVLGFPTMIGTSRKSTIGRITGKDSGERLFGTAATVALAIAAGIDIVRVHDVGEMLDVVRMADAVVRGWRPDGWQEP